MKKLMTRKPAADSAKPEPATNKETQKPLISTSTNVSVEQPNKEAQIESKLKDIQKKTGNKFSLEEIKREYELNGNDEKQTLINLLKQKEEEEELAKRNLFKRIEEANAAKASLTIKFTSNSRSRFLEVLELVNGNTNSGDNKKKLTLYHSKLKEIKENFSKPSPDQLIHINRND